MVAPRVWARQTPVVGTERRLWASCRALGSNLSDRSKWGLLAGSRDMFRYRRQMRKFFGVFGDLFLFNSRCDAGKHFYDNAVLRPLTFIGAGM